MVTFELFREREVGRSYKEGIVVRWMNPEIERQAKLEHEQKMRDFKETLKERDVRQRQRDHDAVQSAAKRKTRKN